MKRLLNCDTSDLVKMNKADKLEAIEASEGRVIVQELSLFHKTQILGPLSDAEVACAFGADLLLFNAFDCENPYIAGVEAEPSEVVRKVKHLTGRMVGLNLEPVGKSEMIGKQESMVNGRKATIENARKAKELGFDFILALWKIVWDYL